jgi:hypothetical protein
MAIDIKRILSKYPRFRRSAFSDDIQFKTQVFVLLDSFYCTIIITYQGDLLITAKEDGNFPKILVDKQYFNQDKLEEDLDIFLYPFRDTIA